MAQIKCIFVIFGVGLMGKQIYFKFEKLKSKKVARSWPHSSCFQFSFVKDV